MGLLRYTLFLLFFISLFSAQAQLELVPLPRTLHTVSPSKNTRTKSVERKLPFWDDFSFADTAYVQDSLWLYSQSVWANKGMGINPPSLGVVTFDGLDSLGEPYNVTDVLAKGFADNLTSQPIRMDLVDAALRPNLFMSFFYQFQGNGEPPDAGDSLFLELRDNTGTWQSVWSRVNDGTLDKSVFTQVKIPITADRFYYDAFQFRFRNYARLSGPYDTWNVDYVFVSNGFIPSADDPQAFPDRNITTPLTSLLGSYSAMPIKHFLLDPTSSLVQPSFGITNRRSDQTPDSGRGGQPVNYVSDAEITTKKNNLILPKTTFNLDDNDPDEVAIVYHNDIKSFTLKTIPTADKFDTDADSISIKLKIKLKSEDNVIIVRNENEVVGDYDPQLYSPIDFRVNDTTSRVFTLADYYAYDDGSAEYGASLIGAGSQLMYRFDMKTNKPDTLVGVYLYFPRFGAETSQIIQLEVFDGELTDNSLVYTESITVPRSQQDQYIYHTFTTFKAVGTDSTRRTFYLGWKQTTTTGVVIGLDKNTDSGGSIYFNTTGVWQQNTLVQGSLMIRPVFGKGGVYVGLPDEEEQIANVYPNPNDGTFYLPAAAANVQVLDITGRPVNIQTESGNDAIVTRLQSPAPGLYIVRFSVNNKAVAQKIIVKQ